MYYFSFNNLKVNILEVEIVISLNEVFTDLVL